MENLPKLLWIPFFWLHLDEAEVSVNKFSENSYFEILENSQVFASIYTHMWIHFERNPLVPGVH